LELSRINSIYQAVCSRLASKSPALLLLEYLFRGDYIMSPMDVIREIILYCHSGRSVA